MISNTTSTIFVFAARIHTKSTVNKNIDQQCTMQRLIMRTSLMIVLFCTAASLFLVFFYNYAYTKSRTHVMHFFQRTISNPNNVEGYSTVHEDEEQRRQQRTREALQTSKDGQVFHQIGMKRKEISSKKTSTKTWNGESAKREKRNKVQRTFAARKNLIILSPGRGGSSFLGAFFDRSPHVMYLFEPLRTVAKKLSKFVCSLEKRSQKITEKRASK